VTWSVDFLDVQRGLGVDIEMAGLRVRRIRWIRSASALVKAQQMLNTVSLSDKLTDDELTDDEVADGW
jgi:hypothetical protein